MDTIHEESDTITMQQVTRKTDNTIGCCGNTHIYSLLYFCDQVVEDPRCAVHVGLQWEFQLGFTAKSRLLIW